MAPLLALDDPAHPHFATKTAHNNQVPFLKKFPKEVRDLIYEHVVKEDYPIAPLQVARHSNKFRCTTGKDMNQRKVVSRFAQTCRQIYFESEAYPVFYRVNTFVWPLYHPLEVRGWQPWLESCGLLPFLAALTPQRRAFLRHIDLEVDYNHTKGLVDTEALAFARLYYKYMFNNFRHLTAMLSQCQDLRVLEVRWHAYPVEFLQNGGLSSYGRTMLKKCVERLRSNDELSLWMLPSLKSTWVVSQTSSWKPDLQKQLVIEFTKAASLQDQRVQQLFSAPHDANLFTEVLDAVATHSHRRLADEALGGGRLKITDAHVHEAIRASKVDFPGENRLHQDRFRDTLGNVSSRTRQKCNKSAVDSANVIVESRDKYTKEGILTWGLIRIHDIRWSNSGIKVEVEYVNPDVFLTSPKSWENAEAVLSEDGMTKLLIYYQGLSEQTVWPDPITSLQQTQDKPPPKDILVIIKTLPEHLQPFKPEKVLARWRCVQEQYVKMIGKLEMAAAEAEEKAAAEAKVESAKSSKGQKKGRTSKSKPIKPKK